MLLPADAVFSAATTSISGGDLRLIYFRLDFVVFGECVADEFETITKVFAIILAFNFLLFFKDNCCYSVIFDNIDSI